MNDVELAKAAVVRAQERIERALDQLGCDLGPNWRVAVGVMDVGIAVLGEPSRQRWSVRVHAALSSENYQ